MSDKLSAIERLEDLLDAKDDEIERLQDQIRALETDIEGIDLGWLHHTPSKYDLPTPRLQMRHEYTGENNYGERWIYSWVYTDADGEDIDVPLGYTRIGGKVMSTPPLPFMTSYYFRKEHETLGLPAYVIVNDVPQTLEEWDNERQA